jgi:hypothetical protein
LGWEEIMSMRMRFVGKLLAIAASATIACSAAHAADNTRYVSSTGTDNDTCSLLAPCRTLQRGINLTPAGGELRILSSGSYGNRANITRSLTISGNGNTVYLGSYIAIDDADAVVVLRDVVLNGQGKVQKGIQIAAAATVYVERCVIQDFANDGIYQVLQSSGDLFVLDSIIRNNGGLGMYIRSRATVMRSTAIGNAYGFFLGSGTVTIEASVMSGNSFGLYVPSGTTARISNSAVTDNVTGIRIGDFGIVETPRNNTVTGNVSDVSSTGTITTIGKF